MPTGWRVATRGGNVRRTATRLRNASPCFCATWSGTVCGRSHEAANSFQSTRYALARRRLRVAIHFGPRVGRSARQLVRADGGFGPGAEPGPDEPRTSRPEGAAEVELRDGVRSADD